MKYLLSKACYKVSRICWKLNLKGACYLFAGWGFKLSHKPKTYDR